MIQNEKTGLYGKSDEDVMGSSRREVVFMGDHFQHSSLKEDIKIVAEGQAFVQLTRRTRNRLKSLKKTKSESYEVVVKRLLNYYLGGSLM